MTILPFLVISFGAGAASLLVRRNGPLSTAIGIGGLAAAVIAAGTITADEGVPLGGAELIGSAYLRLFVLFGSIVALLLAVLGLATTSHRYTPGVLLGGIGAAGLALAMPDARIAVIAATAGGLLGILVTIVPAGDRPGRRRRRPRATGARDCRGPGDPRHGLDRATPRGAGRRAGGVRPCLSRVRHRRRHPLRCDSVPLLGGPPRRCRP